MLVFKGRKFKISVIITYFDILQLKPVVKSNYIHHFTKISSFSLYKVEACSSKFQIGDSFSHFSYHTQLAIVLALDMLISHPPVPSTEQIIVLFKSLGAICMPECYTHTPIISGICHFDFDIFM